VVAGPNRVQEGARAEESVAARAPAAARGALLAVSLLSSARLLSVRVRWRLSQSDPESANPGAYAQRAETASRLLKNPTLGIGFA
jgi:hypothetical protein